ICTTDELGDNDGPDFQSGWGLLNARNAAYAISNNSTASIISELSISDGESYITDIEVDGLSPVSISVAWTDPPGKSGSDHDDLSPRLINDLDIRISGNTLTYEPWMMVPNSLSNNFNDPAIKGDNFRDNVERIDIANLTPGTYTITVSHKGNLVNNSQDFSLVAIGLLESTLSVRDQDRLRNSIRVYPIPLQEGDLRIEIPEEVNSGKYTIHVFDSYGKFIESNVFYDNQIMMNLSHLSSGIYFARIVMDNFVAVKRIVIE
ncbi:MAG: T9SS type A sorting domain-containing protein, partial [Bacteroidales bacterium]|nr:T9SS type A sorting domain-containing protein [Bacteroidales bacterium]